MFTFEFDHFDWLSQFYSEWRQTSIFVNLLKVSLKVQVFDFGQNLKWQNLLNSVPFIKKTYVNHVFIWIWPFWLTFTVLQWMKINFNICQFVEGFFKGPGIRLWSKFENDKTFLILFHSSRKHKEIMFTIEFDHFDWLSQFYSQWRQTSKFVNLNISSKVRVLDFGQNLKMSKIF